MPTLDRNNQPVRNASAGAIGLIRKAILEGTLKPGQRLKEEELASRFRISRTPIREALLILQSEGLVEATPNRGATVRVHDAADLSDLYQLRALLEGYAARQAASRATDEQIALLWSSCDRFAHVVRKAAITEIVQENLIFHDAILGAAGSDKLTAMVRPLIQLPLVYTAYNWYSSQQRESSLHFHRQITQAIEQRDADRAELAIKAAVFEAHDVLVAHSAK